MSSSCKSTYPYTTEIHATGGGAYKFSKEVESKLGLKFLKRYEMFTLITGLLFLLKMLKMKHFYTLGNEIFLFPYNPQKDTYHFC